jgi:hypothetical protein
VGLHLKGHSTFQPVGRKPAVTLKFNEFRAGLRKVHLNNPSRDPSYLCQYVGARVSRAAGVPCPQVGHARVRWNGRDLGLYVLVEGTTRDFLDGAFGNHAGALWEGEYDDVGTRLDVDGLGAKGNSNAVGWLVAACREGDLARRCERLREVLDWEAFERFMAAEVWLAHTDGYVHHHADYRLYQNPATGKLAFIPHGMDLLLSNPRTGETEPGAGRGRIRALHGGADADRAPGRLLSADEQLPALLQRDGRALCLHPARSARHFGRSDGASAAGDERPAGPGAAGFRRRRAPLCARLVEVLERCWRLPELSQLIVAATARLQPVLAQHDGRRAKQQLTAVEFLLRRLEEREREARHQLRELEFDVGLLRTAQAARPAPVGK